MIVITAPTGQIGTALVDELLVGCTPLRLVTRHAAQLPPPWRARCQVVAGSHGDPAVMDRALAGAHALFWLVPPNPVASLEAAWIDFTRPAVAAIQRHGVRRVVSVTALGRGTPWQERRAWSVPRCGQMLC